MTKPFSSKELIVHIEALFRLLHTFVKNPHQPLDRDFLGDEVWGDKTINLAMNRLKKKMNPSGEKKYLEPIWGAGYRLR